MKKKMKVEIPNSALKDIPEDEREGVKQELEQMFDGMEHPEEVGQSVKQLPPGAKYCPECGTLLQPGPTFPIPPEGNVVQIFDCEKCDQGYMGEPLN